MNINNRVANAIIGCWQTSGTMNIQSGVPHTMSIGGVDNSSISQGDDRPALGDVYAAACFLHLNQTIEDVQIAKILLVGVSIRPAIWSDVQPSL